MSLVSETSRLVEKVNPDLLSESQEAFTIEVLDPGGTIAYEKSVLLENPYMFDPTRFLDNVQPMTLPRFIDVANQLVQDQQNREGIVAGSQVKLIEEYPAERLDRLGDEVVAWKLISREPANMNAGATGRKQYSFTHYYNLRSAKSPASHFEVEARPLDHVIEFSCWSKSARHANARALWLERLFVSHAWAFKVQGADRFRFRKRTNDWYTSVSGQGLYSRPLQFFVRLWDFRVKAHGSIKNIHFQLSPSTQ